MSEQYKRGLRELIRIDPHRHCNGFLRTQILGAKNAGCSRDEIVEGIIPSAFAEDGAPVVNKNIPRKAFTLVEVLVAIAIMAILAAGTGPAISLLSGAGTVNKAIGDLSGAFEAARVYAMANHTFVRMAIGQANGSGSAPSTLVVLSLYSANGTENADASVAANWPMLRSPLFIGKFVVNDNLNGSTINTSTDDTPSATSLGTISRTVGGLGAVSFTSFVEFDPSGEASITSEVPSRFIKVGIDQPMPQSGKNPFILRLSGMNGEISILRKESL